MRGNQPYFTPGRHEANRLKRTLGDITVLDTAAAVAGPVRYQDTAVSDHVSTFHLDVDGISRVAVNLDALRLQMSKLEGAVKSAAKTVFITTLDSPRWRLRLALPVRVQADEDTTVADAPDFELFADGSDEAAAIAALRIAICEAMEMLAENEDSLGPHTQSQLRRLREVIEAVSVGA